jgi:hypothetical protein
MALADPSRVARRELRFTGIDDVRREMDRIIAAERTGTLRSTGNWTPGQAFGHLAAWINYGWDGYPTELNPPWFVRLFLRPMARRYARRGFPAGCRIPKVAEGTFATEKLSTDEGAERLRQALTRLESREPVKHHSPAFGKASDELRVATQLRHSELHMSYFWPDES